MRTIIAGSRDINDYNLVVAAIKEAPFPVTEIVSGAANGVDRLGELYGERNGIPVTVFPADWKTFGKSAGPRRNMEMAKYADALIAIWNGTSKGTLNMVNTARDLLLNVFVKEVSSK